MYQDNKPINFAIILNTNSNENIPEIGMYDGKIQLITDSYNISTSDMYENGDSIENKDYFYDLLKRNGIGNAGSRIDLNKTGDFAYLSSFNFKLPNKDYFNSKPFHEAIQALPLDVSLIGSNVEFYVIYQFVWYKRWSGVVGSYTFDSREFKFNCEDKNINNFKEIPKFEDSQITMGYIKQAPLVQLNNEEDEIDYLTTSIARVIPVNTDDEKMFNTVYETKPYREWDQYNFPPEGVDKIGFVNEGIWGFPDGRSEFTRFRSYSDNDEFWIVIENQKDNKWLNKTLKIDDDKFFIFDVQSDTIDGGSVTKLKVKNLKDEITSQSVLFGLWYSFVNRDSNSFTYESDFIQTESNLKNFNTDKIKVTISNDLKYYRYNESNDLTEVERDEDGNIILYKLNENDEPVPIKTKTIESNDGTILISESLRETKFIPADEISIPPFHGEDYYDRGFPSIYDSNGDPINRELLFNDYLSNKLKGQSSIIEYNGGSTYIGNLNTGHERAPNLKIRYLLDGSYRMHFTKRVIKIKDFNENDYDVIKPGIMIGNEFIDYQAYLKRENDRYTDVLDHQKYKWSGYDSSSIPPDERFIKYVGYGRKYSLDGPFYWNFDLDGDYDNDLPSFFKSNNRQSRAPIAFWNLPNNYEINVYPLFKHEKFGWLSDNTDFNSGELFSNYSKYRWSMPRTKIDGSITQTPYDYGGEMYGIYLHNAVINGVASNISRDDFDDVYGDNELVQIRYRLKRSTGTSTSGRITEDRFSVVKPRVERVKNGAKRFNRIYDIDNDSFEDFYIKDRSIESGGQGVAGETFPSTDITPNLDADDLKKSKIDNDLILLFEIGTFLDKELKLNFSERFDNANLFSSKDNAYWYATEMYLLTMQPSYYPDNYRIFKLGVSVEKTIDTKDLYVKIKPTKENDTGYKIDTVFDALNYMTLQYSKFDDTTTEYNNDTNDTLFRYRGKGGESYWNIGRTINDKKSVFKYIQELCQQSFVAGWINRKGNIDYQTWRNWDKQPITHDNNTILRDSIKNFTTTPREEIYNNIEVKYQYNHTTEEYDKLYGLYNVDFDTFPNKGELWNANQSYIADGVVMKRIDDILEIKIDSSIGILQTDIDTYFQRNNGLKLGNSFIANTYGIGYIYGIVNRKETDTNGDTYVYVDEITTSEGDFEDFPTEYVDFGNYFSYSVEPQDKILNWEDFVIGVDDYNVAKSLWNTAHENYLQCRIINKLPQNRSNLIWAIDRKSNDLSDKKYKEYAFKFFENAIEYNTKQKYRVSYDLPMTNETLTSIDLVKPVIFNDVIITPDYEGETQYAKGWIEKRTDKPSKSIISVDVLFEIFELKNRIPSDITITETTDLTDIKINEKTDSTDIKINEIE